MAAPQACGSPGQNLPPNGKDKLPLTALKPAPTNNSGTFTHIFAMSNVSTPAFALLLASVKSIIQYTNENLYRATKLAIELFVQGQNQAQSETAFLILQQ